MFAESKYLSWLIFHICVCWKSVFAFDEYQYLIGFAWIARTINQNYPSPGWQCRCLPSEISSTLKSFCFSLTKISTWISSKTLNLKIDTPCSNSAFERCYGDILIIKNDLADIILFLITLRFNCRSLTKVKFSTDQVRPALGSGSWLIVVDG